MVTIRSSNEIILSLIDYFRLNQPNLDTKPGAVARDLAIDAPANQIALLYDELSKVSTQQSLRLVVGSDLDKLARNFGLSRKTATPSAGIAILTFSSIVGVTNVNKGDVVIANNGVSFAVLTGIAVNPAQTNFYRSIATKYSANFAFVGITDQYAVEVSVQATTSGTIGNIGQYSINRTSIVGVSNVTNVTAFLGGTDQEDDATFRNRILSVFSGSSVGTALGYKNTALATTGVEDAYVVGPGDPLMTRDGSVVTTDNQGNQTIVSDGTGGKVDVVILGTNLVQHSDSYIYQDKSNRNDPTNAANNVVLGQIPGDTNKTITQKRVADIAAGTLPAQPVDAILQVTGSLSGSNFTTMSTDEFGRVSGNYKLIKDTGLYGGSPWGFDTFAWISNQINFSEDLIKGQFNGQDATTFPGVIEIPQIQQNISITNENSTVLPSNRSLIQLLHTPATNVTRVFNATTGERYTVTSQNFNGTGTINTSGVIQISGNTFPAFNDILQVDYNWVITYDQYADYDGRLYTNNPRVVTDSADWSFSNLVREEKINFTRNGSNTLFTGVAKHPISSVITASLYNEIDGIVVTVVSGIYAGRQSIVVTNLIVAPNTVDHVYLKNSTTEVYSTAQNNGTFINSTIVVGIEIEFTSTIILPTDTQAQPGDKATILWNTIDTFNITNSVGSIANNQITIPVSNITTTANNLLLSVTYIANVQNFFAPGITSLPSSRVANDYLLNSAIGFNNTNLDNTMRRDFQPVQKNLSNQLYVELNLSSTNTSLLASQVISVIRLSDNAELWNSGNAGSIAINNTTTNYQLIFTGYNTPSAGDRVLICYFADDTNRFQPFTFSDRIIERDLGSLQSDLINFSVDIHDFVADGYVSFTIFEPHTDIVIASGVDGYIIPNSPPSTALFGSPTVQFGNIFNSSGQLLDITSKKITISSSTFPNNINTYDILSFNSQTDELVIGNYFAEISSRQVSVIRILDGKELWSDAGTIDTVNNKLSFPVTTNASHLDEVIVFYYVPSNLRSTPTRVAVNVNDQVNNSGVLSFIGTTITKATDIVFTATATGLQQTTLGAFSQVLNLGNASTVPLNVKLIKIAKLEKVTTPTITSSEVLTTEVIYDTALSALQDTTFFDSEFVRKPNLGPIDFILPNTINNIGTNEIKIGDRLRITFYYSTFGDTESLTFTRNGTLYTNKQFALIDKFYISSGFTSSQSAKITLANFNQPITGSRYTINYDYTAPKTNERITISYNYNQLISATTFNIETSRPINADVLVREAKELLIDLTMDIVVSNQPNVVPNLVLQNVKSTLISSINATSLGTTLDASNLINKAFSVAGVNAARIETFNLDGSPGQVLSLQAHNDQYFVANNIIINQVSI
jgi:baseplate J-like protein